MFELTLENEAGLQLKFGMGYPFTITDIDGLDPPDADINTSKMALVDGAKFNSAKLEIRQINLAFAIEYSAPYNRAELYKVLKTKEYIKLYYKGDYRDVWIEGYIRKINIDYFKKKQIVTVQILCPSPYLKAAQTIIDEISATIKSFHFPFASESTPELLFGYIDDTAIIYVENGGDFECGLEIEIYARRAVSSFAIWDYERREYFEVDYSITGGHTVTIDTRRGQKSVIYDANSANPVNLLPYVTEGSTWLQLPPEGAVFTYLVSEGNSNTDLLVSFHHDPLFEGV